MPKISDWVLHLEGDARYGYYRTIVGYSYGPNGVGVTFHFCTITVKPKK